MGIASWFKLNGSKREGGRAMVDELIRFLPPTKGDRLDAHFPPKEVTKLCLRLKHLVEQVIPCELEERKITMPNSSIITKKVVQAAREAGKANGGDYGSAVVFCLLVCLRWFHRLSLIELWDAELYEARETACEVIAKRIIESEDREDYLMQETLLKRYSLELNGRVTVPMNAVEKAVDHNALLVIGSSGYQKAVSYLFKGLIVQEGLESQVFKTYKDRDNTSYWAHFDSARMRTPRYQNALQLLFAIVFLVLATVVVTPVDSGRELDVVEIILYVFTAGFIFDEIGKLWKVGYYYLGFWSVFNSTLYGLTLTSLVLRMIALNYDYGTDERVHYNDVGYNFIAFSLPMFWMRLLLFLDSYRFFGAMLVVLKAMMAESLIFFALLIVIGVGFLQAFTALDVIDDNVRDTTAIIRAMLGSLLGSPEFDAVEPLGQPFGIVLYYIYTFIVLVILLNILVALYNSSYESVTDDADDHYMALFASKTLRFIRAPDTYVFIPPFNLLEIFCLIIPFEWWMPKHYYERLNHYVSLAIYSPFLLVTAYLEVREARRIRANRRRGEDDDTSSEEWHNLGGEEHALEDFEQTGWAKKVEEAKPNVETDQAILELRELKGQVKELTKLVLSLQQSQGQGDEKIRKS